MISIAIDGPSGAGKSTVAKHLAMRCNMIHLDTGAMYRALAYRAECDGISLDDEVGIESLLNTFDYSLENGQLLLNGEALSPEIRKPAYGMAASTISAYRSIRKLMQDKQRELAKKYPLIMDGRDIGAFVLPNATYKFYLISDVEERARRRYYQQESEGISFETVLADMKKRDQQDMEREVAPLTKAADAFVIDNTHLTIEETIESILSIMEGER